MDRKPRAFIALKLEMMSINDPPVVVLANTHFNASECVSVSDCSGQPHAHHQPLLLFSSVSPGFAVSCVAFPLSKCAVWRKAA